MRVKIIEHLLSIGVISVLLVGIIFILRYHEKEKETILQEELKSLLNAPISNVNNTFEKYLTYDCMDIFFPGQTDKNREIIEKFYKIKEKEFRKTITSSSAIKKLSFHTIKEITGMYVKFFIVYLIVMVLVYYAVQTIGSLKFIIKQESIQRKIFELPEKPLYIKIIFDILKNIGYLILFSPAYVIAYSIRTEFNTDTVFFMILLGIISNGLLVIYSNKFYAFLVSENRKGYVENALVKNLNSNYAISKENGISLMSIFSPVKKFRGHIFDHIFSNARVQYLSTIKEQSAFLITGLIIIEMALNIHGHLTYELLRQLLYKNYPTVIIIIIFVFYTVKATEVFTDLIIYKENKKYENR